MRKMMWIVLLAALACALALGLACGKAEVGSDCTEENFCSAGAHGPECFDGYEWDDPRDETNLRCVKSGETNRKGGSKDAGSTNADGGSNVTPGAKRIFVTSGEWTGDLRSAGRAGSGLEGADNLCNIAAEGAGLGGSWTAWLSDDAHQAIDRIADVGPWFLVGTGIRVFNNRANLGSTPLVAISESEFGVSIRASWLVWTGGPNSEALDETSCAGWSNSGQNRGGTYGETGAAGSSRWTSAGMALCSWTRHLYCIEQ